MEIKPTHRITFDVINDDNDTVILGDIINPCYIYKEEEEFVSTDTLTVVEDEEPKTLRFKVVDVSYEVRQHIDADQIINISVELLKDNK